MVYARAIEHEEKPQELTFQVSGKLWHRSLVMRDMQTRSLWSHILGECMQGPLKGVILETLAAEMVTWGSWRERHPKTTVLALPRTDDFYDSTVYRDKRGWVFGVVIDGDSLAFPFDVLAKRRAVEAEIAGHPVIATFDPRTTRATLFSRRSKKKGSKPHRFTFDANKNTLVDRATSSRWNPASGEAIDGPLKGERLSVLPGIVSFREPWRVFHPKSRYADVGQDK